MSERIDFIKVMSKLHHLFENGDSFLPGAFILDDGSYKYTVYQVEDEGVRMQDLSVFQQHGREVRSFVLNSIDTYFITGVSLRKGIVSPKFTARLW